RTALYGRRHLLQLVAIKRLQARGLSLAQVQEELLGLPTTALARLAKVPAEILESPPEPDVKVTSEEKCVRSQRTEAFWKEEPVPPAVKNIANRSNPPPLSRPSSQEVACEVPDEAAGKDIGGVPREIAGELFHGIRLRPDVTLLIGGPPGVSE